MNAHVSAHHLVAPPPPASPDRGSERRLLLTLGLTATIMLAELAGGLSAGSLSLLADAGHMLVDLLALGVAYASVRLGRKPADARRTYGYKRLEVLAALLNGVTLVGISGFIFVEAGLRLMHPTAVQPDTMMEVAALGLVANLLGLWLLGHAGHSLSVRGAFLHLVGDTLSSCGVLVGGAMIAWFGYVRIDAVVSAAISVIICYSSLRLLRDVVDVLIEAAPRHLSTQNILEALLAVPGVCLVHDLHVWSITQDTPALSAHLVLQDLDVDPWDTLRTARALLAQRFALHHVTLQLERAAEAPCGGLTC